ncbi:hypothetical protein Syun_005713 [Stephania yunnanensis]|uniref:Uncharacterized protein n=1 Tax=Stephania yunnanensis TaxID=152371 RepID=A0AAP0KVB8_9MAGN
MQSTRRVTASRFKERGFILEKSVLFGSESRFQKLKRLDAAEAKLSCESGSISRALEENKALFVSLYKCFSVVLTERLPSGSAKATLRDLRCQTDNMAVDIEESLEMEDDKDNDEPKKCEWRKIEQNLQHWRKRAMVSNNNLSNLWLCASQQSDLTYVVDYVDHAICYRLCRLRCLPVVDSVDE